MAYQFVTKCVNCAKEFGILWVMDPIQVGTKVARLTCPLCAKRFNQNAKELLPIGHQRRNLVVGRPVRSVQIGYDCPCCGNRGVVISLLHTDLCWDELSKEKEDVQTAACYNGLCPQRGILQRLKPTRVVLGSLNPA
jgi:hypothetical protein